MTLPERLPHDDEAERAVLAAVLLEPSTVYEALDAVAPEDFYSDAHQLIWDCIRDVELNGAGAPDLVTVRRLLDDRGYLARVGGASYLSSLVEALPDVANVAHYAGIVHEMRVRRELVRIGTLMQTAALTGRTSQQVRSDVLGQLSALAAGRSTDIADAADALLDAAGQILAVNHGGVGCLGPLSGVTVIDNLLQGFKAGELYYLGARPRTGKSTLADQIAWHASEQTERPAFVVITEMSFRQRAMRKLAGILGRPLPELQSGVMTASEREQLERLSPPRNRVIFFQGIGKTAAEVRLAVKMEAQRRGEPCMVVVDFIQQLRAANPRASMNERTAEKSLQMRELAVDLQVPVLGLSQLSRACEQEKRAPRLSDLRESGDLEQDAYAIGFLHRSTDSPELVDFILAKHRDGPEGRVQLRLNTTRMVFESCDDLPIPD